MALILAQKKGALGLTVAPLVKFWLAKSYHIKGKSVLSTIA